MKYIFTLVLQDYCGEQTLSVPVDAVFLKAESFSTDYSTDIIVYYMSDNTSSYQDTMFYVAGMNDYINTDDELKLIGSTTPEGDGNCNFIFTTHKKNIDPNRRLLTAMRNV